MKTIIKVDDKDYIVGLTFYYSKLVCSWFFLISIDEPKEDDEDTELTASLPDIVKEAVEDCEKIKDKSALIESVSIDLLRVKIIYGIKNGEPYEVGYLLMELPLEDLTMFSLAECYRFFKKYSEPSVCNDALHKLHEIEKIITGR